MNNWVTRRGIRKVCYIHYKENGISQIVKAEISEIEDKERRLTEGGCTDIFRVYRYI